MSISISIVQVSGTRFDKDEEVDSGYMEAMLPCHSCWDELIELVPAEKLGLCPATDGIMREAAIGLDFSSVGDWPEESFFDHERNMIGIEEVVDHYKDKIVAAIEEKFSEWVPSLSNLHKEEPKSVSILTLWSGSSWCDYEGEWDFDFQYDGVIDLSKLSGILKGVKDDPSVS